MYTRDTLAVGQVVQFLTEDLATVAARMADAMERCEMLMRMASEEADWDTHRDLQHLLARVEGTSRQLQDAAITLHRILARRKKADLEVT